MSIKGLPGDSDNDAIKVRKSDTISPKNVRSNVLRAEDVILKDNSTTDSVDVGLGKSIQQILDPNQMHANRRAHFEELKKKVQGGTYQMPSSDKLASSVAEEITFEILVNGPAAASNGSDEG